MTPNKLPSISRRKFLSKGGAGSFSAFLGMRIPFIRSLPAGVVPLALTQTAHAAAFKANQTLWY